MKSLTVSYSGEPHEPIPVRFVTADDGTQGLYIVQGWTYPPPAPEGLTGSRAARAAALLKAPPKHPSRR